MSRGITKMKKMIFLLLLVLSIFIAGCAKEQILGGDRDSHGCIGSAGYSWCEIKQKCLRSWEENCSQQSKDITEQDKEYNPAIDPANFVSVINNPYYTLAPGTNYTYQTETEEGTEKNIVVVTDKTKKILGIDTIEIWDRVWLDDELIEETLDWYVQDKEGNVWYFGEESKEYEDGKVVSTEGSWEAGVDGAKPGIIMKANPEIGDSYKQEYYKGKAEDMGDVIALGENVTVPYGTFNDCLKTKDWSKIDSTANEHKYYCPNVGGVVLEVAVNSGEKTELIQKE